MHQQDVEAGRNLQVLTTMTIADGLPSVDDILRMMHADTVHDLKEQEKQLIIDTEREMPPPPWLFSQTIKKMSTLVSNTSVLYSCAI